jgi:hypothetical protein
MTVSELRKWLAEKNLPDQWWLSLDTVSEDEPVTLNQAAVRLASGDYDACFILHVSKANEEHQAWIELTGEGKVVPQMSAVRKPVYHQQQKPSWIIRIGGSFVVFCVLLAFVGVVFDLGGSRKVERERVRAQPQHIDDSASAYTVARQFVEQQLKSPRSAVFSRYRDTKIIHNKDGTWIVQGWVDSQNSFGAMIRSNYILLLEPEGNGRYTLVEMSIGGRKIR